MIRLWVREVYREQKRKIYFAKMEMSGMEPTARQSEGYIIIIYVWIISDIIFSL